MADVINFETGRKFVDLATVPDDDLTRYADTTDAVEAILRQLAGLDDDDDMPDELSELAGEVAHRLLTATGHG